MREHGAVGNAAWVVACFQALVCFFVGDMAWGTASIGEMVVLGFIWLGLPTFHVFYALRRAAREKGYHDAWGLMALLAIVGLIVVDALPDRNAAEIRGFPVGPPREPPESGVR